MGGFTKNPNVDTIIKLRLIKNNIVAEWSSLVARRAHNPKVIGSNPISAIQKDVWLYRLAVRTSPSQGGNPGSIPGRAILS